MQTEINQQFSGCVSRRNRYQDVNRLIRKFYLNLLLESDHATSTAQVVPLLLQCLFWRNSINTTVSDCWCSYIASKEDLSEALRCFDFLRLYFVLVFFSLVNGNVLALPPAFAQRNTKEVFLSFSINKALAKG